MLRLLLLLIVVCGCSNFNNNLSVDLNSTFALDTSFAPEEQEQIVKALWAWEEATRGIVNMKLIITDTPNLYSGYTKIIKSDEWHEDKLANTSYDVNHATIFIYYKSIYSYVNGGNVSMQSISEHEMGHAFGLNHANHGIMMSPAPEQKCIDNFTLEQFCNIHYCSMNEVQSNCN